MPKTATYVFCVIAATRRPRVSGKLRTFAGLGPVRLLDAEPGMYLAVADAPLRQYGEAAIKRGLADLEWVSRAAVAHEAVVESFVSATAILPMKLFSTSPRSGRGSRRSSDASPITRSGAFDSCWIAQPPSARPHFLREQRANRRPLT